MHRFIVYQFGKVGSTSVVTSLNQLEQVKAYQPHFLGEEAFLETMKFLLNPSLSDFLFENSSEQLLQNLKIYRYFARRELDGSQLTVVTISREPFDWFQSCLIQEIEEYSQTFRKTLDKYGVTYGSEAEAVTLGCQQLIARILRSVEIIGGIDAMVPAERRKLRDYMDFADKEDFESFLFLLGRFLMPHYWFESQFKPTLGFGIQEMERIALDFFRKRQAWGNVYLLRFEGLSEAYNRMMLDLGYSAELTLTRENPGAEKKFYTEIQTAFMGAKADKLRTVCSSSISRFLGYD